MTDSSWTPPGGAPDDRPAEPFAAPSAPNATPIPPVAPATPETGAAFPPPAFPPPVVPAPAAGAPAAAAPAAGWTPPPKPGLIPLRPLTFGTLLGASFQVLRRNPRPMFGFALLVTGGSLLISALVTGLLVVLLVGRIATTTGPDMEAVVAGSVAGLILAMLIPLSLSIAATALLQGLVVLEVARGTVGEKLTLRGLFRAARGRLWALVGWSLLITVAALIGITITVLLLVLVGVGLGPSSGGAIVVVMLSLFAVLGAVVLAFWLGTRLSLVPSVLVIERLPLAQAVPRAWRLTYGYFWKTLGIQLLVAVILSTVSSIISTPLSFVLMFSTTLFNPGGEIDTSMTIFWIAYLASIVVSVVFGAITAVVQSATTGLIYIDIRMRSEGLDLELIRFVEARQAGDTTVSDPYLARAGAAAA